MCVSDLGLATRKHHPVEAIEAYAFGTLKCLSTTDWFNKFAVVWRYVMSESVSVIRSHSSPGLRTVKKVPFVELLSGRVQGVVSSGSDIQRVYVSFIEAGTGNFYCCTNNNRPCGGMYGSPCKHIHQVIDEAIVQFGAAGVARYLRLSGSLDSYAKSKSITDELKGDQQKESPGIVFSRFLSYLRFCELESTSGGIPEMSWFVP